MSVFKSTRSMVRRFAVLLLVLTASSYAQQQEAPPPPAGEPVQSKPEQKTDEPKEKVDHRILGVLPNYRTSNPLAVYEPLTTKQKFTIAMKDSFDWPNYMISGIFAGIYQMQDQNPSFGQGVKGYLHRYWTSYIDQSMGNLMTEAVMPSILHEDPRYFRKVEGSFWSRLGYAVTRVVITKTDRDTTRFNFSEFIGNGVMASVGNAYYPDDRGLHYTVQRWGTQIGTDAFSNILKEFWPDVKKWMNRHKNGGAESGTGN